VRRHWQRIQTAELRIAALAGLKSAVAEATDTETSDQQLVAIWQKHRTLFAGSPAVELLIPRLDLATERLRAVAQLAEAFARHQHDELLAMWRYCADLLEEYQAQTPYQEWIQSAQAQVRRFEDMFNQIEEERAAQRPKVSARPSEVSMAPGESPMEWLKRVAEDAVSANDLDTAAERLSQAVIQAPGNAELHASLASVYSRQGHISGASDQWQQVLSLDPEHKDAHRQIAHCYTQLNRFEDASAMLEQALRHPSRRTDLALYRALAMAYHKQGRLDEAIWALDRAQSIHFDPKLAALRNIWQK